MSDMYRHLAAEARQLVLADDLLAGAHQRIALELSQGK